MKHLIFGIIGIAVAGCVTRQAVVMKTCEGCETGAAFLEAKHVHLKSILGIDDTVLADTNRFVLGESDYSQEFKLDEPFGRFVKASVYLDNMTESVRRVPDDKPHQLREVDLERALPNATTEEELLAEWQATCDFIADILEIEPPQVHLVDVDKCRKAFGQFTMGCVSSCMIFVLADNQQICVRLTEPSYAMRGGRIVVVRPGYVKIGLMFNLRLSYGGVSNAEDEEVKIEKELDFGPDCREKLAAALKSGIERRTKKAKRKNKPVVNDKSGTNKVAAVSAPARDGDKASRKTEQEEQRKTLQAIAAELKAIRAEKSAMTNACVKPASGNVGNVTRAKIAVDNIKGAVISYMIQKKTSTPPVDLCVVVSKDGTLVDGSKDTLEDPWGRKYRIETEGKRFAVVSAGADGKFGTEDDVRSDRLPKRE